MRNFRTTSIQSILLGIGIGLLFVPFVVSAPKEYMGRIIAQTMHFSGAEWLIRESRDREEATGEVMKQLNLKPGMVVADVGCGNGYYALKMSKAVGEEGQVYAVDIQPEMLELLKNKIPNKEKTNLHLITGKIDDPLLPKNTFDMVIMVDVYHEFSHPEEMLKHIRESLKDEGMAALLEYRAEDPNVPIKPLHKMSKKQILKEFTANGFLLVKEYDGLPWQHLMYFKRK